MDLAILRGEIYKKFKTQKNFSAAIGWNRNKISKLLLGEYIPSVEEAAQIMTTLSLDKDLYLKIFLPNKSPFGEK